MRKHTSLLLHGNQHPFLIRLLLLLCLLVARNQAWISNSNHNRVPLWTITTSSRNTTPLTHVFPRRGDRIPLFAALPDGYQEYGDAVIYKAGKDCGMLDPQEDLTIVWKAGRIIVTVATESSVMSCDDDEDDDDADNTVETINDGEEGTTLAKEGNRVDITKLAKTINRGFNDGNGGGIGDAIATVHSIEVTTPGVPDELSGIMWTAYKSFPVICQFQDPKKKDKKPKTIEGRLVGRDDQFTTINIKGRMKKIRNDMLVSCKLPKAKKEKGGG